MEQERHRILSLEEASTAFALQLRVFPALLDEAMELAGGSFGVFEALMEKVADEISYTPHITTTPERIRSIVGAPEDPGQMSEWRAQLWDEHKARHQKD